MKWRRALSHHMAACDLCDRHVLKPVELSKGTDEAQGHPRGLYEPRAVVFLNGKRGFSRVQKERFAHFLGDNKLNELKLKQQGNPVDCSLIIIIFLLYCIV